MTGGGTLGPVTPLIAIGNVLEVSALNMQIVWVGTPQGPEGELLKNLGYRFISLKTAKLPRYASVSILSAPFVLGKSYFQAREIIHREKPDLVMSAGGYVSVPMIWAARTMGVKTWIHQLDVRPGLANKMMSRFTDRITTSWKKSVAAFPKEKTEWIGSPVRDGFKKADKEEGVRSWGVNPDLPTVLVVGGGTGATWINQAMPEIAPNLLDKMNVIHQTGRRGTTCCAPTESVPGKYIQTDFIVEMDKAFAVANIVVCRAGMGTLSELALTSKPAIVIPMPGSHQEDNAAVLRDNKAAIVFKESQGVQELEDVILKLLANKSHQKELGKKIHNILPTEHVADKIAEQIVK
jgi:UDP-N-acetylglucosamine--N-acetylmuramyl-(pentapeptide) pyrophosphoryl-undecaprenol N-acetylglucosamine transferase